MEDQRKQAWFALWILFGINTMNFFDRQVIAAVTEPIRKEWMLSDTAMGLAWDSLHAPLCSSRSAAGPTFGSLGARQNPQHRCHGVERVHRCFRADLELLVALCGAARCGRGRGELRARREFADR